ncbi:MAG TPA: response regulator [Roseiflexaceae bacterium]|nr:response regulator [Roseiflexaceae bacterium]
MAFILIVDDEANQRLVLEQALLKVSDTWQIQCAGSIQEALDILETSVPDLLITDYHIAAGTGVELVQRIRALQHTMPVILITADDAPEIAYMANDLGIDHHLTKPVPLTLLRQVASQVLYRAAS